MKRSLFVTLFALFHLVSSSQTLSGGVRGGVSKGFNVGKTATGAECGIVSYAFEDADTYKYPAAMYSFDKSLFIRYQTHGRYAMELNANHHRLQDERIGTTVPASNQPLQSYTQRSVEDFYSFSLLFQYDIGLNSLKNSKIFSRFTPYLGMGLTQTYRTGTFTSEYALNNTSTNATTTEVQFETSDAYTNINYQLSYRVNKHLTLSSLIVCGFQTSNINWKGNDLYFMPMPNARIAANVGISYGIY